MMKFRLCRWILSLSRRSKKTIVTHKHISPKEYERGYAEKKLSTQDNLTMDNSWAVELDSAIDSTNNDLQHEKIEVMQKNDVSAFSNPCDEKANNDAESLNLIATKIENTVISPDNTAFNSNVTQTDLSWRIGGASVIGAGHIANNTACQDNHHIEYWTKGWGVALIADGAGSKKHSEIGSQQVTQFILPKYLKKALDLFILEDKSPSELEWKKIAIESLANTYSSLADLAEKQGHEQQDYACTVMFSVFSPFGILFAHIGDGRACYRDQNGQWHALLTPMKGEEANQTLFITEPSMWISQEIAAQNIGVKIVNHVTGFSLMTDGCEKYFFECTQFDQITQKNIDKNNPFQPTFNFFYSTITNGNWSSEKISDALRDYLENDENLKKESDDKTLLIAVQKTTIGEQK